MASQHALMLELVNESKIVTLLGRYELGERFEASGVCVKDGDYYVIFDNMPHIARIASDLSPDHPNIRIFPLRGENPGYEDIAYHLGRQRFYILIEASEYRSDVHKARIEEFDDEFRYQEARWLDFPLKAANKGLEGVAYVQRDGSDYVLGLCEGNKCQDGRKGRTPGGGRIQVFRRGSTQWEYITTVKIPETVLFEDYAAIDVMDKRVVVVSQATSAAWVGILSDTGWEFVDARQVYYFPSDPKGETIYCNIEGVAWVTSDQIAVVSDKMKKDDQPTRCQEKDQSIHIFRFPVGDT
jgi:hypothetical protein